MNTVPMIWVLPITGPDKGRGRTCYVCQLGSSPVIAAFIRPASPERGNYIEYVQKLFDKHPALKAFIVILSTPEEHLQQELIDFANERNITVPITLLDPQVGLPDAVPVNDEAEITILLYRGRFFERKIEYLPNGPVRMTEFMSGASKESELEEDELNMLNPGGLEATNAFQALDAAAHDMISRD